MITQMSEIEQAYIPYIGKSYYCELDDGIVFTIKGFGSNLDCLLIHIVNSAHNYHTIYIVNSKHSFEVRQEGLHFQGCPCIEITELQKAQMIHYFDKIHKKYKEYVSFRENCVESITNILNQKDDE